MPTGIRDKVAIIGMGCTRFGERWDVGAEDLMVEAFEEALADAGIDRREIQAAWLGTCFEEISVGKSALPLSITLRLPRIPVTRVENFCATGTEAFRGAVYAVASGACDIALALGVEKLKDVGYGGLPNLGATAGSLNWQWMPNITAWGLRPAGNRLCRQIRHPDGGLKALDGSRLRQEPRQRRAQPQAHLRRPVTEDEVLNASIVAYPLGLYDCCGVSDGAACAIVATPDIARAGEEGGRHRQSAAGGPLQRGGDGLQRVGRDVLYDHRPLQAGRPTRRLASPTPGGEISMMEVHDCFSITELVTMEDLHISERGKAWKDVLDGFFDLRGGGFPASPMAA